MIVWILNAGSELELESGTERAIKTLEIMSTSSSSVKIASAGNATINFFRHEKYCYDYLEVSNVIATGAGVANAGENGIINNAVGWNAQKCEDVLFADFKVKYPCKGGLTLFADASSGKAEQWDWIFPSSSTKSGKEVEFSFSASGSYPVSLKVSNNESSHMYSTMIEVGNNTLAPNQIVTNNGEMYSFNQAIQYQWFRNEMKIPDALNRFYADHGEDGTYSVVTYDSECNRFSDPLVITGLLDEAETLVNIYPNPSHDELVIESKGDDINVVTVSDVLGKKLIHLTPNQAKVSITVNNLSNGVYFVETLVQNVKYHQRIIVNH